MKRIISMVMSILMIMTMFCGVLSVGSVADETYDATTNIANITVEVGEIQADNTVEIKWWLKDTSPYGYYYFSYNLDWDETSITPVVDSVIQVNGSDYNLYFNITDLTFWAEDFSTRNIKKPVGGCPVIASGKYVNKDDVFLNNAAAVVITNNDEDTYNGPFKFSDELITELEWEPYTDGTYDADKGILCATGKFNVLNGTVSADDVGAERISVIAATQEEIGGADSKDTEAASKVSVTVLGATEEEKPAGPTLPEGMTVEVINNASVRTTTDYTGMRFTTIVTVTDPAAWESVAEMGTVIVPEGQTPENAGKKLMIPARVEYDDGKYIQDRVDPDSAAEFVPGLNEFAKSKNEIKYTGVMSNVKKTNYGEEFTAYAYVKLMTGEYVYSVSKCTRSMETVCNKALDEGTYGEEEKAKVQALIDYYTAE